jgi:hypothetical protein
MELSTLILNFFLWGGSFLQWLATQALECRPAVALLAGLDALKPKVNVNLSFRYFYS